MALRRALAPLAAPLALRGPSQTLRLGGSRTLSSRAARASELFALLDRDRDGRISAVDLRSVFASLGETLEPSEAGFAVEVMAGESGGLPVTGATEEDFEQFYGELFPDTTKGLTPTEAQFMRDMVRLHARLGSAIARLGCESVSRVRTEASGTFPSHEFRLNFFQVGATDEERTPISPWHDIPLTNADGTLNMVVEIPKWSRAKMEIATKEPFNPIKQDVKKGALRSYTWGDMMFNYGALPQTWESPDVPDALTGKAGDNDPLDVIDLGMRPYPMGSVLRIKPLGALAMIDGGETDWKIVGICAEDRLAEDLNDMDDVFHFLPGAAESFREWMRLYKSPDVNSFAFDGEFQSRDVAEKVIRDTHDAWKELVAARGPRPVLA